MSQQRLIVPENAGRLDQWLAAELGVSRSAVGKWCKEGRVTLDGKLLKASVKPKVDQVIVVDVPEADPIEVVSQNIDISIVYEDDDVIVVNKPAGMVVHPGAGNPSGTLINGLVHKIDDGVGDKMRPGIVHRIDKDTQDSL